VREEEADMNRIAVPLQGFAEALRIIAAQAVSQASAPAAELRLCLLMPRAVGRTRILVKDRHLE